LKLDTNYIKDEFRRLDTVMSGYVSIYRFDRFKKYNGLKEEHEAAAMTAK
jgi:hypothetical protein